MKSKTSFFDWKGLTPRGLFNRTLFVKNLTRNWPLWALASFFGGLFPLAIISEYLRHGGNSLVGGDTATPLDFTYLYYMTVSGVPIVMLGYCILCAMQVWGYLYNARNVGLMHALPIRREGLFVTNCLSGLTMVAIPCAVTGFLAVLASVIMGVFDAKGLLVTVLAVAGEGFFYFASATAAAFVTGNIFALPMLYFVFHFLASLCDVMISSLSSFLIFGLEGQTYTGVVDFLSPTVYLLQHVRGDNTYEYVERTLPSGGTITDSVMTSVWLTNAWVIGVYALVGVGLLAIALILYRLRRSECAGDVIAVGWAKPVFHGGVTAVAAIGGGQLLYLLFWNGRDQQGRYTLLPLIVCMIIAGVIGYYAAAMLLAKTLRVFKGSWPGVVATAAACVVLCSSLYFDGFGIAGRIPDNSRLVSVGITVAGNSYNLYPDADGDLIDEFKDLQRAILADQNYVQSFDFGKYMPLDESGVTNEYLRFSYYLKNGLSIDRRYMLPLTKTRMETPGTYDYLLNQFVNGEAIKNKRLHAGDPSYTLEGGSVYVYSGNEEEEFSSRELGQILNALRQDTAAGAWDYVWFDEMDDERYAMNLRFSFYREDKNNDVRYWDNITVYPRKGMEHTIAALKNMGYVTDADLLTLREYTEKMETNGEYAVDQMDPSDWEDMIEYGISPREVMPDPVMPDPVTPT